MKLGSRLYGISRRRRALAVSLTVAVLACVLTLSRPSLSPPGLHARGLQVAAASTEVLVATPNLAVGGPGDYLALVNRGILVGNVMVSGPVLAAVAHALGIPERSIQATAPLTANVPRTLIEPGSGGNATDLIASPDQYKLEIQADPSVPILHVYAQAPTAGAAERMAKAAVDGVAGYLTQTQTAGKIPENQRVRIQQLGPVTGGVANSGAPMEIALLVFLAVLGICLWLSAVVDQIRRGWTSARLEQQLQL